MHFALLVRANSEAIANTLGPEGVRYSKVFSILKAIEFFLT